MFPLRPKLDWGPAATDIRHLLVFNGTWELPFGPKRRLLKTGPKAANALLDNWALGGIFNT